MWLNCYFKDKANATHSINDIVIIIIIDHEETGPESLSKVGRSIQHPYAAQQPWCAHCRLCDSFYEGKHWVLGPLEWVFPPFHLLRIYHRLRGHFPALNPLLLRNNRLLSHDSPALRWGLSDPKHFNDLPDRSALSLRGHSVWIKRDDLQSSIEMHRIINV